MNMKNIRINPQGDYPKLDKSAYIDPTAVIIGRVSIGKNVFVGHLAVIRADEPNSSIRINDNCNVQDRVIIHALGDSGVVVGRATSLSHACIIHGPCEIGEECFIGFGSVVFKANIGKGVYVGHLAVVEGVDIPSGRVIYSKSLVKDKQSARKLNIVSAKMTAFMKRVVKTNLDLAKSYKYE
jgi:carbonic anhydrase/acetyltransferase-like protein (isoleucine patch superfamily)